MFSLNNEVCVWKLVYATENFYDYIINVIAQLSHAQYELEADYIIDESKLRFTLTKDDTYKFGVIDRLSNKIVLQPKYEYAMFYSLNDYT